ncbi:hypothetical protein IWW39_004810 [Coemansia spiralis]|uniref:Uncharacterized protein n=1 Tax=Coemansia spiralis TaxID=417178 RepID=A0A9W8GB67_9FUNG|nr:hypothetical protein IWW39_004810 [Coemansia spiralis]
MASLSPLQTLPLHAVEMIVDQFVNNIRHALSKSHGDKELEQSLKSQIPLLWVCRSFRSVVYSQLFTGYELTFDINGDMFVEGTIPWMPCLRQLDGPHHLVAKKLTIQVSAWAIYAGKALKVLSSEPYDDYSFPMARTLEIKLVDGPTHESSTEPSDMVENVAWFVRWVWQAAPKINHVELLSGMSTLNGRSFSSQFHVDIPIAICFEYLTIALTRIAKRIKFGSRVEGVIVVRFMDVIRDLVHLRTNFCHNALQTMELIRQNAPTLQYLHTTSHESDISGIIRGDDGAFVEYPHLETLYINHITIGRMSPLSSFDGAVPFPSLRRLICGDDYPFSDELVLFRGNAATLEYLHLPLTRSLANTLIRHGVFTRESHPKLQYVILLPPSDIMSGRNAGLGLVSIDGLGEPDYARLMMDIAPGAAVRKIYYWAPRRLTPPVLSLFSKHVSLQVLVMPKLRLSIWDAMTLIRLLPSLSNLHALAPTLDPLPAGVTSDGLIPYVLSNYSPMAVRFRKDIGLDIFKVEVLKSRRITSSEQQKLVRMSVQWGVKANKIAN